MNNEQSVLINNIINELSELEDLYKTLNYELKTNFLIDGKPFGDEIITDLEQMNTNIISEMNSEVVPYLNGNN